MLAIWWLAGRVRGDGDAGGDTGQSVGGGSRQCAELAGLPTKDEAQEKWRGSAVWLLATRVCSWARMDERERRRESPGRGAEGVTADISPRVLRLFLSPSSSCPLNQTADRRGRPTRRSKRKSVPSSISARRNRTSAEWAGCQPRNTLRALFLFAKTPAALSSSWLHRISSMRRTWHRKRGSPESPA